MKNTLRLNLFWDYINRFGNLLVGLITSTILARLLAPADYGLVGIAFAVNGLAGVFLNLGFVSAIIQLKELENKSLSTVFFLNIGISLFMSASIFFTANLISSFYHIPDLSLILKVTSVSFIINALNIIPSALLMRAMRFKEMAMVSLASSVLSGFLGIYLALHNYGVWSIVMQQIFGSIVTLVSYWFLTRWMPKLYYRISSIRSMMRFGFFMFLSGLLDGIFTRIDIFLIAKVFTPASLGLYSRAQNLDVLIRSLSSGSILNVLFPTFAAIKEDNEKLKQLYYEYFQIISFIFCFLAGFFYLGAEQLFLLLFGDKWNDSAVYFKILVLAGFAYPLSSLSLSIIEARGNSKSFFFVEVIKKILFLPTYFIAYYYGIIPFLISYVIACFVGTFINVRFLKFELDISVFKTVGFLSNYFISALLLILLLSVIFDNCGIPDGIINAGLKIFTFTVGYYFINILFDTNGLKFSKALILNKDD